MAAKASTDQFANQAIINIVESAMNTLTFKKLETGISLNEKVAWVISRVEYFTSDDQDTILNHEDDCMAFGLSLSNTFTTVSLTEATILDMEWIYRRDIGAAASGFFVNKPITKDFSTLPGGGIITPPTPLYGFVKGSGATAAITVVARLWYTLLPLAVDQYWELVEARRVLSS